MVKSFDLSLVTCIIGGVPISGYGATDAVTVEPVEDLATVVYSADGKATRVGSKNKGARVTVTLMSTSLAYKLLAQMMQAQDESPVFLPLPFYLSDPSNGDLVTAAYTVFTTKPTITKAKNVSEVSFGLELPEAKITYGGSIVL